MSKTKIVKLSKVLGKDKKGNLFVKGDKYYNTVKVVNNKTIYLGTGRYCSYLMILDGTPDTIYVEERMGKTTNLLTLPDATTSDLVNKTLIYKEMSNINNKESFDMIANYLIDLVGLSETERIFRIGFKIANKVDKDFDDKDNAMLRENRVFLMERFNKKYLNLV